MEWRQLIASYGIMIFPVTGCLITVASFYRTHSLSLSLHICTQDQEFSAGDKKIYNKNIQNSHERMEVRQDGRYEGIVLQTKQIINLKLC
jgi:hypothetical protein